MSGEKLEKVVKSWNKWGKLGKSWKNWKKKFKMAAPAILDDQKSLSIAFLAISDQYATFIFLSFFSKWPPAAILEVPFGPFWMTENHFRSHFSPFQINKQLFFLNFFFLFSKCAKNNRVLPLCVINGYAKYEVDR